MKSIKTPEEFLTVRREFAFLLSEFGSDTLLLNRNIKLFLKQHLGITNHGTCTKFQKIFTHQTECEEQFYKLAAKALHTQACEQNKSRYQSVGQCKKCGNYIRMTYNGNCSECLRDTPRDNSEKHSRALAYLHQQLLVSDYSIDHVARELQALCGYSFKYAKRKVAVFIGVDMPSNELDLTMPYYERDDSLIDLTPVTETFRSTAPVKQQTKIKYEGNEIVLRAQNPEEDAPLPWHTNAFRLPKRVKSNDEHFCMEQRASSVFENSEIDIGITRSRYINKPRLVLNKGEGVQLSLF